GCREDVHQAAIASGERDRLELLEQHAVHRFERRHIGAIVGLELEVGGRECGERRGQGLGRIGPQQRIDRTTLRKFANGSVVVQDRSLVVVQSFGRPNPSTSGGIYLFYRLYENLTQRDEARITGEIALELTYYQSIPARPGGPPSLVAPAAP